ncbi:hypothetical protein D4R71_03540 [bacterium]|nr:MAG: hypothetical protein D4R71_03540 [bacterium]
MNQAQKIDIFTRLNRRMNGLKRLGEILSDPIPGQKRDTISRVAVEGRSITNILQNLRSVIDNFDVWYQPFVVEMSNDPLLKYFYQLRTSTLKKGDDKIKGVRVSARSNASISLNPKGIDVKYIDDHNIEHILFHPQPQNTISKFLGDQEGGAGFVLKTPDGKEVKQYVYIPSNAADIDVFFENPPNIHLGTTLPDKSPKYFCKLYIDYLTELVSKAEEKFLSELDK